MLTIGQQLKAAREAKGATWTQASQVTHIKTQQLAAMEADDFSSIPAAPYVRGFIKLYAQFLGLNPTPLLELYAAGNKPLPPAPPPSAPPAIATPPRAPEVNDFEEEPQPSEHIEEMPVDEPPPYEPPVFDPSPPPATPHSTGTDLFQLEPPPVVGMTAVPLPAASTVPVSKPPLTTSKRKEIEVVEKFAPPRKEAAPKPKGGFFKKIKVPAALRQIKKEHAIGVLSTTVGVLLLAVVASRCRNNTQNSSDKIPVPSDAAVILEPSDVFLSPTP